MKYFIVLGALALSLSAQAGLFSDDEAREAIVNLRARVDANQAAIATLQKSTQDSEQSLRKSLLDLSQQIQVLEQEQMTLQGKLDELNQRLAAQNQAQQSLQERLTKFEPTQVSVDNQEFVADPKERQTFEDALDLFRQGEHTKALTAWRSFIRDYPQSGYYPTALFWLGNTQYVLRDYKGAIANFRLLVSQYPKHLRVPEAMLAIANCYTELKDTKAARKTLEELSRTYPDTQAGQDAKERLNAK